MSARDVAPRVLVAVAIVVAAALLVEAARSDSVTVDEFAHLPAGLYYLHTRHFNVYNMSPPLLRAWCALPVWWAGVHEDFAAFIDHPNHWLRGRSPLGRWKRLRTNLTHGQRVLSAKKPSAAH